MKHMKSVTISGQQPAKAEGLLEKQHQVMLLGDLIGVVAQANDIAKSVMGTEVSED